MSEKNINYVCLLREVEEEEKAKEYSNK